MRINDKHDKNSKAIFGFDLHDFIQKETGNATVELANEYGISIGDVQKLKKQLERN